MINIIRVYSIRGLSHKQYSFLILFLLIFVDNYKLCHDELFQLLHLINRIKSFSVCRVICSAVFSQRPIG